MYQVEGEVLSGGVSITIGSSTDMNNGTSNTQSWYWPNTPCPYCDPPRCPHCGRLLEARPYYPVVYPTYPYIPTWPLGPWITYTANGCAGNT